MYRLMHRARAKERKSWYFIKIMKRSNTTHTTQRGNDVLCYVSINQYIIIKINYNKYLYFI